MFLPKDQIVMLQLETNAGNVERIESWVNNNRFKQMQHVVTGALFILNKNTDLKVDVANGT
jgi:hypothetical protein